MLENKRWYNFMLCGDSIAKGVIYDDERKKYTTLKDNFAALVQNRLNGVIHNCSRFGSTLIKGFDRLQRELLNNRPDVILLEFGGNDCDFNWPEVAENPLATHEPRTDFNRFQQMLREAVQYLQEVNIAPVLLTIPPIDADRYFNWISKDSAVCGSKILTWLGSVCKIYWWQERYNSAIVKVATETGARWIDIREAFLRQPDFTRFLCTDGIHPNRNGHRLMAGKIIEYLSSNYRFLLREEPFAGRG